MSRSLFGFAGGLVLSCVCVLGIAGCSNAPPTPSANQGATVDHEHAGHDHSAHEDMESSEVEEALASLSAEDRAAARKQKICPVTDELLGSMGTPPKISVNGRDVFICCAGCEDSLKEDAAIYLAKLPE